MTGGTLRGKLWLSIPAAHEESGIPASTLRRWCAQGKVRCRQIGRGRGRWQILVSSLRSMKRR